MDFLEMPVESLELSVRSANCLRNAEIRTVKDLVRRSERELLTSKNFGRKSLSEIKEVLAKMGLRLRDDDDGLSLVGAQR